LVYTELYINIQFDIEVIHKVILNKNNIYIYITSETKINIDIKY